MKRFLRFGGESYYPQGGWYDFMGAFDTLEEAQAGDLQDWNHVVDSQTRMIVARTVSTWDQTVARPVRIYRWEEVK